MNKRITAGSVAFLIATALLLQDQAFGVSRGCGDDLIVKPQLNPRPVVQPTRQPATVTIVQPAVVVVPQTRTETLPRVQDENSNSESDFYSRISATENAHNSATAVTIVSASEMESSRLKQIADDEAAAKKAEEKRIADEKAIAEQNTALEACQNELSELNFLASQILDSESQKNLSSFEKFAQNKDEKKNEVKANADKEGKKPSSLVAAKTEEPKKEATVPAVTSDKPAEADKTPVVATPAEHNPAPAVLPQISAIDDNGPLSKIMGNPAFVQSPELRKMEMERQMLLAGKSPAGLHELKQSLLSISQASSENMAKILNNPDTFKALKEISSKNPATLSDAERQLLAEWNKLQGQSSLSQEFITQMAVYEQQNGPITNPAVSNDTTPNTFRGRPMVQRTRDLRKR